MNRPILAKSECDFLPKQADLIQLRQQRNDRTQDRRRVLNAALQKASLWNVELLAAVFRDCKNPSRAARAMADRKKAKGHLCSATVDVYSFELPEEPLHVSATGGEPDFEALSYRLLQRFSGPTSKTTVYWPSAAFAQLHGTSTGTDRLPNFHQVSHNLLVTAVWLRQFALRPNIACDHWTSERELQFRQRRGEHDGPMPDALIEINGEITAIEVGGAYPASWIRHHVEQFEAAGWRWELW